MMIKKVHYSNAENTIINTIQEDPKQDILRANLLKRDSILRILKDDYAVFDLHVLCLLIILMILTYPLLITTIIFTNRIVYAFSVALSMLIIYPKLKPLLRINISIMVLPLILELLRFVLILLKFPLVNEIQLELVMDLSFVPFDLIFSYIDLFYFVLIYNICIYNFKREGQDLYYKYFIPLRNIIISIFLFLVSIFLRSVIVWLFNLYFISLFLVFLILVINVINIL